MTQMSVSSFWLGLNPKDRSWSARICDAGRETVSGCGACWDRVVMGEDLVIESIDFVEDVAEPKLQITI